ncbi:exodeoxyribonuclease VII small subunit [Neptunicella marina]|uniref:Exodeoxyribonuclease 7 small subunit n=1 Tax=Neptunicella marina TaxID=2125989 RepID=A0A8J6IKP9_9ALTE|nr:exodeoxyribonuclease VII small subunit [Neptunicella marina]MBC3764545.1 exodeoxyribonuclease VII small subunit [Neptunicella marina]
MTTSKQSSNLTFEQSLQELESIVNQMEQGDLELDQALKQFERGIHLARQSQQKLTAAEQKVKILLEQQGQEDLFDFDAPQQGQE